MKNKTIKYIKKDISLSNLISNRVLTNEGWEEMDNSLSDLLELKFKEFILSKCHYNKGPFRKISHINFKNIENIGLYDRLVYNIEREEVYYIAGQSYPEEIALLKKFIIKG